MTMAQSDIILRFLSGNPEKLDEVADLLFAQWGDMEFCSTWQKVSNRLQGRMSADNLPFSIVALEAGPEGKVIGTASITFHELPEYRDRECWLSEVCVSEEYRSQGLGSMLVDACETEAHRLGVSNLNLYTTHQRSFYERMGWFFDSAIVVDGEVCSVMSKNLTETNSTGVL